jgi:hypothetical protein
MQGGAGRLQWRCAIDDQIQTTNHRHGSSMTTFRSRTRARNPCGQPSQRPAILPTFCPTDLYRAARSRIVSHGGCAWTPADQGECNSGEPRRTDLNAGHPAEKSQGRRFDPVPAHQIRPVSGLRPGIGRLVSGAALCSDSASVFPMAQPTLPRAPRHPRPGSGRSCPTPRRCYPARGCFG